MSKLNLTDLEAVSESAAEILKAIAGNSDAAHPNDPAAMVRLWDDLNDRHAPPAVVKAMADELINLRQHNQVLRSQRIADRRRFSNPASAELVAQEPTGLLAINTGNGWRIAGEGEFSYAKEHGFRASELFTNAALPAPISLPRINHPAQFDYADKVAEVLKANGLKVVGHDDE